MVWIIGAGLCWGFFMYWLLFLWFIRMLVGLSAQLIYLSLGRLAHFFEANVCFPPFMVYAYGWVSGLPVLLPAETYLFLFRSSSEPFVFPRAPWIGKLFSRRWNGRLFGGVSLTRPDSHNFHTRSPACPLPLCSSRPSPSASSARSAPRARTCCRSGTKTGSRPAGSTRSS